MHRKIIKIASLCIILLLIFICFSNNSYANIHFDVDGKNYNYIVSGELCVHLLNNTNNVQNAFFKANAKDLIGKTVEVYGTGYDNHYPYSQRHSGKIRSMLAL